MTDGSESIPPQALAALVTAKQLARSLDDVRAVDYGFAYDRGQITTRTCVRFHMNRKRSLFDLPSEQRLPEQIDGVEVDVLGIGYVPHAGNARGAQDVLQPGISIGSRKQGTTGTLGAIVRDMATQQLGLISNWHVLCGGPEARPDDEICQPGPMDAGNGRTVARLQRFLRLGEQFDAALALLAPDVEATGQLFATTFTPTATRLPALGMRLVKSGAVSGVTHALIDGIAGSYRLNYTGFGDQPRWMQGFRLVHDPDAPAAALSLLGDSGALWVDSADGQAVGLHFAGEDDDSPLNDYALAHPIGDVLQRLDVALAPALTA